MGSSEYSHVGLLGELDLTDALTGGDHVLVLDTHDTTTPVLAVLVVVVELRADAIITRQSPSCSYY